MSGKHQTQLPVLLKKRHPAHLQSLPLLVHQSGANQARLVEEQHEHYVSASLRKRKAVPQLTARCTRLMLLKEQMLREPYSTLSQRRLPRSRLPWEHLGLERTHRDRGSE